MTAYPETTERMVLTAIQGLQEHPVLPVAPVRQDLPERMVPTAPWVKRETRAISETTALPVHLEWTVETALTVRLVQKGRKVMMARLVRKAKLE